MGRRGRYRPKEKEKCSASRRHRRAMGRNMPEQYGGRCKGACTYSKDGNKRHGKDAGSRN
ncbi:hypothetical protein CAY53_10975 [Desulfobulbus oralis]|uniref:Uncharacterized protein n=1 Tax=Desulfobulbus oralis TaxID=1986146 RepID=A0A2L1GQG9_9BACT|nr:hypothetical protein CAY53_10975 [Desulfobulbus oralis]